MIHRIVKMTFHEENVDRFLDIFNQNCEKIRAFQGCKGLKLLQQLNQNVVFTYSLWESDDALQNYRNSEVFRKTWNKTKQLFSEKPEAWSTELKRDLT